MIFLEQSLKIAAHEGAHAAIVPNSDVTKVTYQINQILTQRGVNGATISITPGNHQNSPYGTMIQVNVSAPCNQNSVFAPWFYNGKTLTGTVVMMKET